MTIHDFEVRIDYLCWQKKWKKHDLAKAMGVSPSVLSRMINGNPNFNTIVKIADALGVPTKDLFTCEYDKVDGFISIQGIPHHFSSYQDLSSLLETRGMTIVKL